MKHEIIRVEKFYEYRHVLTLTTEEIDALRQGTDLILQVKTANQDHVFLIEKGK